jgi:hypothetical protein
MVDVPPRLPTPATVTLLVQVWDPESLIEVVTVPPADHPVLTTMTTNSPACGVNAVVVAEP